MRGLENSLMEGPLERGSTVAISFVFLLLPIVVILILPEQGFISTFYSKPVSREMLEDGRTRFWRPSTRHYNFRFQTDWG